MTSLLYRCLLLALPQHSQTTAEQLRPAAPPLSPGVLQTEPGEGGEIIKDVLCQESLSRGSVGEPRGEGEQQVWIEGTGELRHGGRNEKEGDGGGRRAERERAKMRVSISSRMYPLSQRPPCAAQLAKQQVLAAAQQIGSVSALKSKLKKQSTATGSGVAMAFLRAQAALFGSYRDALRYRPTVAVLTEGKRCVFRRRAELREYSTAALNQPFVSLDTLFIIFPGRPDSEHQFKASSGPAASSSGSIGKQVLISSSSPSRAQGMG
ncbi:hypothetical protein CRENBAI_009077 [Crenichthys baileyi]|uniref:Uncharacterized protein n=1 Tax=Crenichthys baileyi TaxID=28760 RepID=A0AAV9RMW0_9TELE